MAQSAEYLSRRVHELEDKLDEYEQMIEAIRAGEIDGFALHRNDQHEVFTLPGSDFAYRMLVENFGEGALTLSDEGLIVYTNDYFLQLLKCPYESVIGKPIFQFIHEESKETFRQIFKKGQEGKGRGELNLIAGNSIVPVYVSLTSLHPTLPTVGMVVTDISEKKAKENILKENQEKFNALFQLSPFCIALSDAETGKIVDANENYVKTFGHSRQELIGKTSLDLKLIDSEARNLILRGLKENGRLKNVETEIITKAGEPIPVLVSAETIVIGNKKYFLAAIIDIADKKASEASLRQIEELHHRMIDEVQDYAIILLSKEGIIENWNQGAEKIKGYKANEIIGKSFSVFYTAEDRESHKPERLLELARTTGKAFDENWRVKKDGSKFWGSIVITALHNNDGNVIGYVKVTRDLTERKFAEEEIKNKAIQLEAKNMQLEKANKELESFAYISSHDLQEPLRKIQTFATRIVEKEADSLSDLGKDYFSRMQSAARRMQTLIEDLLTYSRTNTAERNFEITGLNEIVEEVKEDLREDIREKQARLEVGDLCKLKIIVFQFRQLFHNIISNALKFAREGTDPLIRITSRTAAGIEFGNPNLEPTVKYCHISIEDNGIGFEKQYNEKIFEVFQRLHGRSEYKGTGIGLSIVKKIVENHGGIIAASGEPGKGARFDIYIPAGR